MLELFDYCLQDVNRGGSRHKLLEEIGHDEGDSMVHGESGDSSINSIPFQVQFKCQLLNYLHSRMFNYDLPCLGSLIYSFMIGKIAPKC